MKRATQDPLTMSRQSPGRGTQGRFTGLFQAAKKNASILVAVAVLGVVGSVADRGVPDTPQVPLPHGWAVAPQPGATLCLAIEGETVWAGGKNGLHRIDRKTGAWVEAVDLGDPSIHIRSLAVDADGALWIGHVDGLIRLANGAREAFGESDGLPNKRVNALLAAGGRVYVGTAAGLVVFERGRFHRTVWSDQLASRVVNVLYESSEGVLWIGSSSDPTGGVSRVVDGRVDVMRVASGLPHPYVQAFVEPEPGEFWVATGQFEKGGAARVSPTGPLRPSLVLHKSDGLAGAKVRSLGVDAQGDVWFGSESDGLAIRSRLGTETVVITTAQGLPHNEITAIERDSDGAMWLATLAGVVRIDARSVHDLAPWNKAGANSGG